MAMEKLLNEWVLEHFSMFVIIVCAIIIAIISITAWCCNILFKVKKINELPCNEHMDEISDIKGKVFQKEELPCTAHQQKISEHGEALARLETSIEFLTRNVNTLTQEAQKVIPNNSLTQTHSPLSITDKGKEKIKTLHIDTMFNNNWPRIKELIDNGVKDKNAYDIDHFCLEQAVVYPEKFLTKDEILVLKNDAYKEGFTLTSYMKMISVLSRDKYFEAIGLSVDSSDEKNIKEQD